MSEVRRSINDTPPVDGSHSPPSGANPFDGAEFAPDTGGDYRGYTITHNPKPIPYRGADWDFCHKDWDLDDPRIGAAASAAECRAEIDEIEEELAEA